MVVFGTICDCDDYDLIADWGAACLDFLRRYLPYHHGVPGGRWLTMLMNRIDPGLFSAAFTSWVRQTWPDKPDFAAIDGKTSRRSHNRNAGKDLIHLVFALATTTEFYLRAVSTCRHCFSNREAKAWSATTSGSDNSAPICRRKTINLTDHSRRGKRCPRLKCLPSFRHVAWTSLSSQRWL